MTGTLSSDYILTPGPCEVDLDEMGEVVIEPSYHQKVLPDPKVLADLYLVSILFVVAQFRILSHI